MNPPDRLHRIGTDPSARARRSRSSRTDAHRRPLTGGTCSCPPAGRAAAHRSTPTGGTCSWLSGTRCCLTRSTRPSLALAPLPPTDGTVHGPRTNGTQHLPPRPPTPLPPPAAGFTVDAVPPGDLGAPLVGRSLLYWWPNDGWQRGTVAPWPVPARVGPSKSHVVTYHRQTSALCGTADTLLDATSYGSRWVLFSPAPAAGVAGTLRPRAPRP
jgi:hypothetical protein